MRSWSNQLPTERKLSAKIVSIFASSSRHRASRLASGDAVAEGDSNGLAAGATVAVGMAGVAVEVEECADESFLEQPAQRQASPAANRVRTLAFMPRGSRLELTGGCRLRYEMCNRRATSPRRLFACADDCDRGSATQQQLQLKKIVFEQGDPARGTSGSGVA